MQQTNKQTNNNVISAHIRSVATPLTRPFVRRKRAVMRVFWSDWWGATDWMEIWAMFMLQPTTAVPLCIARLKCNERHSFSSHPRHERI